MKMAAIIFLCGLSLSLTACSQDVSSARCDGIAQLDARVSEWRERLADLQHRPLTDQTTPQIVRGYDLVERDVVAVKEALAQAEAVRDAAVAQAASEGMVCSRSPTGEVIVKIAPFGDDSVRLHFFKVGTRHIGQRAAAQLRR